MKYISIPKERIGVLIGKDGKTKKRFEKLTDTKIDVDKNGGVHISGKDSLNIMKSLSIVKAIGRGFSPVNAELLIEDDYMLDVIRLFGTPAFKKKTRGRLIGKKGRIRKFIEEALGCKVSIFHNTVSIICKVEKMGVARKAVEMIIKGASHNLVYKYIENHLREL